MAKDDCCGKGRDLVKVGDPSNDGEFRPFVRHKPNCEIEAGFLRRAKEGEPFLTGAIQLGNYQGNDTYEVLDEIAPMHSGPSMVATEAYRKGWDQLFGNKTVGQA